MSGSSRPKWTEEEEPAGNGRRNKSRRALLDFIPFPLYSILTSLSDACFLSFLYQKGTTGSRSGAPPSSRPARRRRGLRDCHTLSRVNTV